MSLQQSNPLLQDTFDRSGLYVLFGRDQTAWDQITEPIDLLSDDVSDIVKPIDRFAGAADISALDIDKTDVFEDRMLRDDRYRGPLGMRPVLTSHPEE